MTAIHWHAIRSRPRHHAAVAALSDAWSNVAATLREWRRRAYDRTELARLDDGCSRTSGSPEAMPNS